MRDLESIRFALTIAETGHLVFATLHTNDSAQAVDRMVDVFPADQQPQIRVQLANTLTGICYQRLMPRMSGGLVAAFEVLVATHAVRNLIREGKTNQLRNQLITGASEGMQTIEMALSSLVLGGQVDYDEAVLLQRTPARRRSAASRCLVGGRRSGFARFRAWGHDGSPILVRRQAFGEEERDQRSSRKRWRAGCRASGERQSARRPPRRWSCAQS